MMSSMTPLILLCVAFASLVLLQAYDRMRERKMWRETLAYLRSRNSYEAEDAIDRMTKRDQSLLTKQLAKKKREEQNLHEPGEENAMEEELREQATKAYESDSDALKPLP